MTTSTSALSVKESLRKALEHFQGGDFQAALGCYQGVLASDPEHPTANHNVGAIALKLNRPMDALGYFNRALKGDPGNDQHWVSLVQTLVVTNQSKLAETMLEQAKKHGVAEEAIGRIEAVVHPIHTIGTKTPSDKENQDELVLPELELGTQEHRFAPEQQLKDLRRLVTKNRLNKAEKKAREIIERYPSDPRFHEILGHCLFMKEHYDQACQSFETAVSLDADKLSYLQNLAKTYAAQSKYDLAVAAYKRAQTLAPDNTALLLPLGNALYECFRLEDAMGIYENMLKQNIQTLQALIQLGVCHQKQHRYEDAKRFFNSAIQLAPNDPTPYSYLAALMIQLNEYQSAIDAFDTILAKVPDNVTSLQSLALTYIRMGAPEKAVAPLRRAMAAAPTSAMNYQLLADAAPFGSDSDAFKALLKLTESAQASDHERAVAQFVAGGIYFEEKNDEAAFATYHQGNALVHKDRQAKPGMYNTAKKITRTMDRRFFNIRRPMGSALDQPLFISGMPRSGKSLLEKLVAQSPDVSAARELKNLQDMLPGRGDGVYLLNHAQSITRRELTQNSQSLLRALQGSTSSKARYISETTPKNTIMSYYAQMFPNAPVIFCDRDPWDLMATCYFKYFASAHNYSFAIATLEEQITAEKMLMAHWLEALPNPCLKITYEDLVRTPRQVGRQLADFLGISWEDSYGDSLQADSDSLDTVPQAHAILSLDHNAAPVPLSDEFIGVGERFKEYFLPYISTETPFTRQD
ncbi:MAG: sulfotransferase family protein [Halomonadaceae bacterium]|nr:MAG: sulfotransferase family protein [Halomonadaceae bacterium]